jgi:hypothetical protein
MPVSSRQELVEYCLRRLGAPVIEINVDEDQVSDRVDDALQFFREYHYDGVERMFLKQQVFGSYITFDPTSSNPNGPSYDYQVGEVIVGLANGVRAIVKGQRSANQLDIHKIDTSTASPGITNFIFGETIKGLSSNAQYLTSAAGSIGAIDLGYITVPDSVIGVLRVLPIGSLTSGSGATNIFDVMYQFRQNDMYNLLNSDLIYYDQVKQHLDMMEQMFAGDRSLRFNRKTNRIYLDMDWEATITPGEFLMVECYRILDPADYPKIYDDMFLKKYLTALIKRQWAENLIKFAGIQLPGGVTLNGPALYQTAVSEIEQIEADMQARFELPPEPFIVG